MFYLTRSIHNVALASELNIKWEPTYHQKRIWNSYGASYLGRKQSAIRLLASWKLRRNPLDMF
eukprot:7894065-Ditylum_brightwellii.AAC.1